MPPRPERQLQDFQPLLLAELSVLRAASQGDIAKLSYRRPRAATPEVRVRAEFLSFLARGGDTGAPVRRRGVQVMGAYITGQIDLGGAEVETSLWLFRCSLGGTPTFDGARILGSLNFSDCSLPGLQADYCRIDGHLAITAGCDLSRELRLGGSHIGGQLDLARVRAHRGIAASRIQVGGDIVLEDHAESAAELCFAGARIGGSFRAGGARLGAALDEHGTRGVALDLDGLHLGGDLLLNAGFTVAGTVRLVQARIQGDFDGSHADFDAIGDANWDQHGGALRLDRARIDGALVLRGLRAPLQGACLMDTQVGTLADDAGTWGQHHVLDGFTYRRFGPGAPTDAATRLGWLARQRQDHLDPVFRPQPWSRLLCALRAGGHAESAKAVAIERERHLRHIGQVGVDSPAALRWLVRVGHRAWGAASGYGHRPWRLAVASLGVWLVFAGAYWLASETGDLPGRSHAVCRSKAMCAEPPPSRALAYSFERLMPGHIFESPSETGPWVRRLAWLETAVGWALALAAADILFGFGRHRRA